MDAAETGVAAGAVTRAAGGLGAVVVGAGSLGLLLAAVFGGGGSGHERVLEVGAATLALLAAAAVGARLRVVALPLLDRAGVWLVGAAAALLAWTGVSLAWSIAGDRSWDLLAKGLVYGAFLAVGLLAGAAGPRARTLAAGILALTLGLALAWALAGKAIPGLYPDGARAARLRSPVGYWNGLALLADAAFALALWLGASVAFAARGRGAAAARGGGAVLAFAAVLVIALTASRAGVVGGAAGAALWLLLARERVEGVLVAVAAALPAALVTGWAYTRPALVENGAAHADRVSDGAWFGVLTLTGAAVAAVLALLVVPALARPERRRAAGRAIAGAAAVLVVAGAIGLVASVGNPFSWAADEFGQDTELTNDPGRLTSLDTNNRREWWGEAWEIFTANRVAGTGAGTFEIARKRVREDATSVTQPHSVPLQALSDTGLVGGALLLLLAGAAVAAAVASLRRAEGGERAAAVPLLVLLAVYGLHSLVDYGLDFVALTAPAVFAAGVLAGAGRPPARPPAWLTVGIAALAAAAVLVAIWSPAASDDRVEEAIAALDAGRAGDAEDAGREAQGLNPLAVEPLFVRAAAGERGDDLPRALAFYLAAVDRQPENPETWYQLGLFQLLTLKDSCGAYYSLNEAYTLDPNGRQWTKGGPLDEARDDVNAGACER